MHNLVTKLIFRGDFSKQNMIKMYRAHNENIRKLVPPERLLVIDVTQGQSYSVLTKFLKVRPPASIRESTAFPHVNNRADFQRSFITNSSMVGYSAGLLTAGLPYLLWAPVKREVGPPKKSHAMVPVSQAKAEPATGLFGMGGALGGWF
jgi:hypothetical protein